MADILDRLLNDGRGCYSVKQIGRSISEPQPEFVQLLVNVLRYSNRINNWVRQARTVPTCARG